MGKRKKRSKAFKFSFFPELGHWIVGSVKVMLRLLPVTGILLLGALVLMGVKNGLYADSGLTVHRIEVNPPEALPQPALKKLESMLFGKNILRVDLSKVAHELEKDPEIQRAELRRHFPSLIQVEVTRRTPIAFIRYSPKGNWGLVSEDGTVLSVTPKADASLCLMEAFALGKNEPRVGEKVKSSGFHAAVAFLKAFWQHPLSSQETITKIGIDTAGQITVTFGAGPQIRMGRKPLERLDTLQRVAYLLESDERLKIDYIDLQFDNVLVKRKG